MKKTVLADSYLAELCGELSMLLQAGITPDEAVLALIADEPANDGKTVLKSLLAPLDSGSPLSAALCCTGIFPQYMADMVKTGEQTGRLPDTLGALSEHYDRQERITEEIKNAVIYPAVLFVLMAIVVLIMITRVLPIFSDVFARLGGGMPPAATMLMRFGTWLSGASAVLAVVAVVFVIIAVLSWNFIRVRETLITTARNLFDRGVFGAVQSSRFISVMAVAAASGLDMEKSAELAASVSGGSKPANKRNELCIELIRSGCSLPNALREAGILSAGNARILSVGVRSGRYAEALNEIARRSEQNTHRDIARIVGGIEPALVISASLLICIILLSVMLPMMGIMNSLG